MVSQSKKVSVKKHSTKKLSKKHSVKKLSKKPSVKKLNKPKIYFTHDNGGRPFKIEVSLNNVTINVIDEDKTNEQKAHYKLYDSLNAKKIFIGKSPLNEMTEFSGGHGKKFDGNTILLEIGNNKYKFIGDNIFTFSSYAKIVKYVSPVGNNDVPYPYAIDINKNIYLFIENVVLGDTDELRKYMKDKKNDPYTYYYKLDLITPDMGISYPKKHKQEFKEFDEITKFFIGKHQYTFRFSAYPNKEFNRLTNNSSKKLYVMRKDNKKTELTKKMYINLMKKFGEDRGFSPLLDIKIEKERVW
jgi:hypothetical protein